MADEVVVVDPHAALAADVNEQVEQGKAALHVLETHSNANAAGSTVHTAIDSFGKVFAKLTEALHLHKQRAAEAEQAQAAAVPAGGALTAEGKQETDQAAASVAANAETLTSIPESPEEGNTGGADLAKE